MVSPIHICEIVAPFVRLGRVFLFIVNILANGITQGYTGNYQAKYADELLYRHDITSPPVDFLMDFYIKEGHSPSDEG